jgi:hypothetical protein
MLALPGAAFTASIELNWNPSTDATVVGYKVYYQANSSVLPFNGTGATEGSSPIDVGNTTTTAIDGLAPGSLYYFAVTAYNSTGLESDYSNIIDTADSYTLAYTAGANGTISGTTPQVVSSGGSGTLVTAVDNPGYLFVSWSDGVMTAARTDANVTANISVTANFAVNTNTSTYTLTYAAGANGTISGTTPQDVSSGGSGTLVTAVANPGYHFVSWSDGVTTAARTDANVTANISVTASFAVNTYTITFSAGSNGSISGTKTQSVGYGSSTSSVKAVPNRYHKFVNWTGTNGFVTSTENPLVLNDVKVNKSIKANFK